MTKVSIHRDDLFNPTLQALRQLGGSGTIQEIDDKASEILRLTDEQIQLLHNPGKGNQTEIKYRLAWARTWLKRYGLLENSDRGVWALRQMGRSIEMVDPKEVKRVVSEMVKQEKKSQAGGESTATDDLVEELPEADDSTDDYQWRDALYGVLKAMDPIAFERLCQRLLRESGFTKVEVTQAGHDGGIDGKGILHISDFLSFRVVFQCKRYSGSVGPDVVQKLRGAMPGNADRGLIVTTGHFTQGAIKEAAHEHKSPIELVDGEELIEKLKELELGVSTEMVEQVTVNPDFFANI